MQPFELLAAVARICRTLCLFSPFACKPSMQVHEAVELPAWSVASPHIAYGDKVFRVQGG